MVGPLFLLISSDSFPRKNDVPKILGSFDVRKVSETKKYTKNGVSCYVVLKPK
jgi:hypothetical protein